MSWGAVAGGTISAVGGIASSLISNSGKKGGETVNQEPLRTNEQNKMEKLLADFARTGKFGDFKAGESFKGDLGSFTPTTIEKQGQSQLMDLIQGGMPELFKLGSDEFKKLLTTDKFDPYSETGVYKGFKTGVLREGQEASDMLKRNLAVTGDTFSTAQVKEQGDLSQRTHETLSNKMAELFQDFSDKKLRGAEVAAGLGLQEEGVKSGRIGLSQTFGSLERLLKDSEAKAKYGDWLRARTEHQQTIESAKSVLGTEARYGIKSATGSDTPSPYSQLLNTGLGIASDTVGAYLTSNKTKKTTSGITGGIGGTTTTSPQFGKVWSPS